MTVRDFMMLALILVVGLIFNRCAFDEKPVYDFDHGGTKVVIRSDRSLEESLDRLDQQLNEFGEEIDRQAEDMDERLERQSEALDEAMEKAGEKLEESMDGADAGESSAPSSVAVTRILRDGSPLHLVLPSACTQTTVKWGGEDGPQWRIALTGEGEVDAPEIAVDKEKGFTTIAFGERKPETVKLALPARPFRLTIKEPDFIDVELLDGELALRLGRIGNVKAVREGGNFTLSGEGWTLALTGIEPPVRAVDSVGRVLGEFSDDGEAMLETGVEGGAQ